MGEGRGGGRGGGEEGDEDGGGKADEEEGDEVAEAGGDWGSDVVWIEIEVEAEDDEAAHEGPEDDTG